MNRRAGNHQRRQNMGDGAKFTKEVKAMLYAPTGAIVCPFKLTIALAENASINGVEFAFDTQVDKIEKAENGYKITAGSKDL